MNRNYLTITVFANVNNYNSYVKVIDYKYDYLWQTWLQITITLLSQITNTLFSYANDYNYNYLPK